MAPRFFVAALFCVASIAFARAESPPPLILAQAATDQALRPLAGSDAPVPVPETAEDVDFDGSDGTLQFSSSSSVKAVAAFYAAAMKPLGWRSQPSVINRSNMVVIEFAKGDKDLSITILQMGDKVNVNATGSGLVTATAKPDASNSASAANEPATEEDLQAEDAGGFPVPKKHSMSGTESAPFRAGLTASLPIDLNTVLAFYRRELGKRGWKEQTDGAVIKPDQVVLAYAAPDGPAILKLGRSNGETSVSLAIRKPAEAQKAGLLPKPGQARLLFGNILPTAATVTINKQAVNVAGGVGSKAPDGPSIEIAPGKYKFSFKVGSKPAQSDDVEIGSDEIWGLLIGPGGALTLQVY